MPMVNSRGSISAESVALLRQTKMEPPADDNVTRMPIKEELKENSAAATEMSIFKSP